MRHALNYIKKYKLLLLVIMAGFFLHMLVIVPSGTYWCYGNKCGMQFWGTHEHDTVWHMALSSVSFNKWPFISPVLSGATLAGYNYLLDLVVFLISKLSIPLEWIYFKIIPPVWFFLFTYLLITVGRKIKDSPVFVGSLLFFAYFGGSFGFLFTLFHKGSLAGASSMLAMQSLLTLTNLQFAISLLLLLVLIYLYKTKQSLKKSILTGTVIFLTFGLKFYAGLIALFFVGANDLLQYLKSVKTTHLPLKHLILHYLILGFCVLSAVIIFYNPFASLKTGIPLIFSPFSIVHPIIEERDLFYLADVTNARYFLYSKGFGPKLLLIELFSTGLFILFNLGARFFGILYFVYKVFKKKATILDAGIFLTVLFAFSLSILFIQKGEWWNTIQFSYYALFLANFFIAEFIHGLSSRRNILTVLFILLLIAANIPENIDVLRGFNPVKASSYIPEKEMTGLNFLKSRPFGVVYVPLYEREQQQKINGEINPPYPLYAVVDSAYVPAFTGKQAYLTDIHVLKITGIDYEARFNLLKNKSCTVLKEIRYIYEVKTYPDPFTEKCRDEINRSFKPIFTNELVRIYGK